MFASPVVILFTSNTPLSCEINSFKDLSAWIINWKDADTSPLTSEKCWLSNGLCLIFALLCESRGLRCLLSFQCWVWVNMWRECLLWVSTFLTKQRQCIFHMLVVMTHSCLGLVLYTCVYVLSVCLFKCKSSKFARMRILPSQSWSSTWPNPYLSGINFNVFTSLLLLTW